MLSMNYLIKSEYLYAEDVLSIFEYQLYGKKFSIEGWSFY
jgi:hypothetical protein